MANVTTRKYSGTLIVILAANEEFKIITSTGRTLLSCVMAADENTVDVTMINYTEHALGTDIGDTGWTP